MKNGRYYRFGVNILGPTLLRNQRASRYFNEVICANSNFTEKFEHKVDSNLTVSAGLRFVEAPGQQCYRKVVDVMIISTMHRICFNSKVKECSCCTNNTSYLSYCLQTRHVSTFASSKVSDEIYFSFESEFLPLQ